MAMSKYQTMSRSMFYYLNKGVINFAQFMRSLRSAYDESKDDIEFIKNKLFPCINEANTNLRDMIKVSRDLVQAINYEVEKNVAELKRKNDEIQALENELAQLEQEKRGHEQSLQYAETQARAKENELQRANEALENARSKLRAGEEERRKAQLAAKIMWAIPFVGWVGASIATIVDCTALKDVVDTSQHSVNLADDEYTDSKKALEHSQSKVSEVNQKISAIELRRKENESKRQNLDGIVRELREYQKLIISLNEDVKKLDRVLEYFNGRVKALALETDGGYCIDSLKSPSIEVIVALSKLMQSDIMNAIRWVPDTREIRKNL